MLFTTVKAGPDCPEIDGDFCHKIAGYRKTCRQQSAAGRAGS